MQTLDFALMPEPSRQGLAQFHASEIFRLWSERLDVHQLVRRLQSQVASGYRVAAVLPSQELDAEDLAVLERSGVLVVEVPQSLSEASEEKIATYLTSQLSEGYRWTAQRMAAMGTTDPASSDSDELQLSEDEEQEFLEFVNDPANQIGGHF